MAQHYSEQQLAQLWIKAGGDPKAAPMMAKIAVRESGGKAHINNAGLNKNGSIDYGLWQINSIHGYNPNKLYDPLYNAKAAVAVYKSQGPKAWATYNPAIDKKYIGALSKSPGKLNTGSSAQGYPSTANPSGDMKKQLALSLLGFGGGYGGGADPLDSLTQSLLQQAQRPKAQSRPKATTGQPASSSSGSTSPGTFDGKRVAGWIVPILKKARATGYWKGGVNSGIRSKSEQLAAAKRYGLQHYPHGPLASNHVEGNPGAVDVSDPEGLKRALKAIHNNRLKSAMPEDPVHFSGSGY